MATSLGRDVCDLSSLYSSEYTYCIPKDLVEGFLSGAALGQRYSVEEVQNLRQDIDAIYKRVLSIDPLCKKSVIITAGAPGAGKTTQLVQELEKKSSKNKRYAYICPDDVCLRHQERTYQVDLAREDQSPLEVYDKWRAGSNAAMHVILAHLIRDGFSFAWGTTGCGLVADKLFPFIKEQGYRIKLIHVSASDETRLSSVQERNKTFVQVTEQNAKEKGVVFPQKMGPLFLKYADKIDFYYRGGAREDAIFVAKWKRNDSFLGSLGILRVLAPPEYDKIKAIHNAAITLLKRPDLSWESTVEQSSSCSVVV